MKIATLTAPTCSGKTTVERVLVDQFGFGRIISHTTRKPRTGEVDGVDYHFVDHNFFATDGGFIETATFDGNMYGAHASEIQRLSDSGVQTAIIVAEPNGVHQIQQWCSKRGVPYTSIFLFVPDRTRYERFLRRFLESTNPDETAVAAARMVTMRAEESWLHVWKAVLDFKFVASASNDPVVVAGKIRDAINGGFID